MRRIGAMTGVVIAALLLAACQPPPARMRATSPGPPVTRPILAHVRPHPLSVGTGGGGELPPAAAVRTAGRAPTIWADWSAPAVGQPFFAVDNVHFNPAGQDAWARWVSDMVHHITTAGTCQLDVEPAPG